MESSPRSVSRSRHAGGRLKPAKAAKILNYRIHILTERLDNGVFATPAAEDSLRAQVAALSLAIQALMKMRDEPHDSHDSMARGPVT